LKTLQYHDDDKLVGRPNRLGCSGLTLVFRLQRQVCLVAGSARLLGRESHIAQEQNGREDLEDVHDLFGLEADDVERDLHGGSVKRITVANRTLRRSKSFLSSTLSTVPLFAR